MIVALALALIGADAAPAARWQRPWITVKAMADIPYGVGVGAEVFVHDTWSVGLDVNFSPAGVFYRAHGTYWPLFKTGLRANQFLAGFGGDVSMTFGDFPGRAAFVVIPASVDMRYLGRPLEGFGFIIGLRNGIGFGAQPTQPAHFAFSAVVYAGIAFIARSTPGPASERTPGSLPSRLP